MEADMGMAMKDVRENLSELVKRVTYGEERITFGPNRGDDVTLVATDRLHRLEEQLREARERLAAAPFTTGEPQAFAGLQQAFDAGVFSTGGEVRTRRLIPEMDFESSLTREERVRAGERDTREPRFRRTRPRA
jgi:hypothetical protein